MVRWRKGAALSRFGKVLLLLLLADALYLLLLLLDVCGIRLPWIADSGATPMRLVSAVLITIALIGLLLRDIKREKQRRSS